MTLSHPLDYVVLGSALAMIVGLLIAMYKEWHYLGEDEDEQ
jgi:hypothetical protein